MRISSPAVREVGETSCSRVEAEHSGVAHVAGVEVLVVVEGQAENEPACRSYRLDARPICGDPVDLPRLSPAPDVAALIDRDPLGVAESRLAEYAVEEDLGALQGQYGFQGFISPLFRGMTGLSGWDVRRYGLVRVREVLLGHEGVTARVSGVPVVRISSQLLIELCVFVQLVPVQADAQPGAIGDLDRATLVLEHASVDDVVFRQSYPEGREQTAVYHVLRSCHKARLRAGEEAFGEVLDVDDLARRPSLRQYAEVGLCSGFSCRHGPRVAVAAPDPPSTRIDRRIVWHHGRSLGQAHPAAFFQEGPAEDYVVAPHGAQVDRALVREHLLELYTASPRAQTQHLLEEERGLLGPDGEPDGHGLLAVLDYVVIPGQVADLAVLAEARAEI